MMQTGLNQNLHVGSALVLAVRPLTATTRVLRLERGFDFMAGQYVRAGLPGEAQWRDYSIYSSPDDDALEILVKETIGGLISPQICHCQVGDTLMVEGPLGRMNLGVSPELGRFVFVATGTGIAPFHSMICRSPDLDYLLLHGVSYVEDLYDSDDYLSERFVSCVTRELGGDFNGRVTDFLRDCSLSPDQLFYFCGNSAMIFDACRILTGRGVARDRLFAEIYF